MKLWGIDGNAALKARLLGHEPGHAYIIGGQKRETADKVTALIAQAMVCSGDGEKPCRRCRDCRKAEAGIHPDIIFVRRDPKKTEILVSQIREMCSDTFIRPNEAERKVYIIEEAEYMNMEAQNALLRTLEEPPGTVGIILSVRSAGKLIKTVRSRCVEINVEDNQNSEEPVSETVSQLSGMFIKALNSKITLDAIEFMSAFEKADRECALGFVECADKMLADLIRQKSENNRIYLKMFDLLRCVGDYLNYNVNTGYIAGMLCANIIKNGETGNEETN